MAKLLDGSRHPQALLHIWRQRQLEKKIVYTTLEFLPNICPWKSEQQLRAVAETILFSFNFARLSLIYPLITFYFVNLISTYSLSSSVTFQSYTALYWKPKLLRSLTAKWLFSLQNGQLMSSNWFVFGSWRTWLADVTFSSFWWPCSCLQDFNLFQHGWLCKQRQV